MADECKLQYTQNNINNNIKNNISNNIAIELSPIQTMIWIIIEIIK
jgi:hypothetical protein